MCVAPIDVIIICTVNQKMCIQCAGLAWIGNYSTTLMYTVYFVYLFFAAITYTAYSVTEIVKDFLMPGRAAARKAKLRKDLDEVNAFVRRLEITAKKQNHDRSQHD